ncbi:MAG TPA: class I SAM-dependent methyltransferase, partial [Vicinamibacterales bacterium]
MRRQVVKWRHYFPIYEQLLDKYRGRPITVVEVGVAHGGSLEAWRSYFGPAARIIGIDLDPATRALERDGFEILIGDQSDPAFWRRVLPAIGPIDVLIDDGGHASVEQIVTAAGALPHIADGGIIIVEDTHSAYMPKHYPAPRRFGL